MYTGFVATIKKLDPIEKADRLLLATILDTTIVVSIDEAEGERGIYFPCDGILDVGFAGKLNLLEKMEDQPDGTKKNVGGYLNPDKPRIRSLTLRGQRSDGLFVTSKTFVKCFGVDPTTGLEDGAPFNIFRGQIVCTKYVSEATRKQIESAKSSRKKSRATESVYHFPQHIETDHYAKVSGRLVGKHVVVTEKLHGTSARIGNVAVDRPAKSFWEKTKAWFRKVAGRELPKYEVIHGTRRVNKPLNGGFYKGTDFREKVAARFAHLLEPGEIVYGEIVGYDGNKPIMADHHVNTITDKKFKTELLEYAAPGGMIRYNYGIEKDAVEPFDFYVYRITRETLDGQHVDLPYHAMAKRASILGLKVVPLVYEGCWQDDVLDLLKVRNLRASTISGLMEGIVIRLDEDIVPTMVKFKTFAFKVLEGIAKEDDRVVDTEEAEGE